MQCNLTLRKEKGQDTAFFAFADTVGAWEAAPKCCLPLTMSHLCNQVKCCKESRRLLQLHLTSAVPHFPQVVAKAYNRDNECHGWLVRSLAVNCTASP